MFCLNLTMPFSPLFDYFYPILWDKNHTANTLHIKSTSFYPPLYSNSINAEGFCCLGFCLENQQFA